LELEPERIVGIKNVTYNEPFMMGHFPDYPVMQACSLWRRWPRWLAFWC